MTCKAFKGFAFTAGMLTCTVAAAFSVPQPLTSLLQTVETAYQFDPATVQTSENGRLNVMVYGQSIDGGSSRLLYEISCPDRTFRQLAVIEVRDGRERFCTNPSEPIKLKPEKHQVPAKLFAMFCR
jgi:hypothetical protein